MFHAGSILVVMALARAPAVPSGDDGGRGPVPSEEEQGAARDRLRELYGEEFTARRREEKRALARRLLGDAPGAATPILRYVLLDEARTLAAGAGDVVTATAAARAIALAYRVDRTSLTETTLETLGKSTRDRSDARLLAELWLALAESAFAAGDDRLAARAAAAARAPARRAKDRRCVELAAAVEMAVRSGAAEYARVKEHLGAAAPTGDAAVDSDIGRYLCLHRGEWERGLPFLAAGEPGDLRSAAARDLENPVFAEKRRAVADGWWDLARKARGPVKDRLLSRAVLWYERARPEFGGADREQLQARVREIRSSRNPFLPNLDASAALLFDGRDDHVVVPSFIFEPGAFTVEAVVRPHRVAGASATVAGNDDGAGFALGLDDGGRWAFSLHAGGTRVTASSDAPAVRYARTHVAGVFDGERLRLFVDGAPQRQSPAVRGEVTTAETPLVVGASPEKGGKYARVKGNPERKTFGRKKPEPPSLARRFFAGVIDDVRLSRGARYETRFTPAAVFVEDEETVVLYSFDEGSGNIARDLTDFHDGHLEGPIWIRGLRVME